MQVNDNPLLAQLNLDAVVEATEVLVFKNPALDGSALRRLELLPTGGRIRIAGNAGETLPLAPCRWVEEGTPRIVRVFPMTSVALRRMSCFFRRYPLSHFWPEQIGICPRAEAL